MGKKLQKGSSVWNVVSHWQIDVRTVELRFRRVASSALNAAQDCKMVILAEMKKGDGNGQSIEVHLLFVRKQKRLNVP